MRTRMIITILVLIVIFGGIFGWYAFGQYMMKKYFASFVPEPQVISTSVAKAEVWQPVLKSVGNLYATDGVDISPEVSGQIKAIYFKSGEEVKLRQPLIQLDDSSEQAQLKDIRAQYTLAKLTLERNQSLFKQNAVSKSALDDALSKANQFRANLENVESSIAKKLIRAPFEGKIGINQINVGQFLSAGQVCASLQSTKALYIKFSVAQQDIRHLVLKQKVDVRVDTYENDHFEGYLTAIDSKIDDNTRTLEAQAAIENGAGKLLPGMFADVQVSLNPIPNSIVLPQTVLTSSLYGDSVFVVTLNGKKDAHGRELGVVKRVFVRAGDRKESSVLILEGVHDGDIIVSAGQTKLDDGSSVAVNNTNPIQ